MGTLAEKLHTTWFRAYYGEQVELKEWKDQPVWLKDLWTLVAKATADDTKPRKTVTARKAANPVRKLAEESKLIRLVKPDEVATGTE